VNEQRLKDTAWAENFKAAALDDSARVLVIALNEAGRPGISLQRPRLPGQTIETMLDSYVGHPDVLAVYLALPVNGAKVETVP
jgi:hypothetical protein